MQINGPGILQFRRQVTDKLNAILLIEWFCPVFRPNRTRGQSFFSGVKKIKIYFDQKPGAIAFFVEAKICSAPNKV